MKRKSLTSLRETISEGFEEVGENVGSWRKGGWRPLLNVVRKVGKIATAIIWKIANVSIEPRNEAEEISK